MQEVELFAGNLQYWTDVARDMDSLGRLSTAARLIVERDDGGERAAAKAIMLRRAE